MIKVVALDLGNVVLDIDIETHLRALGIKEEWSSLSQWKAHWDFETGKLSTAAFYQAVRDRFSLTLKDQEIERGWLAIIRGFLPGIPELLAELNPRVQLVAVTNTNAPHMNLFCQMKEFEAFHHIYASNEVGFRKPDRQIYQTVINGTKVKANEIAFFDDLHENIAAAQALGIQAFHCYRSADRIRSTLTELEVF